MLTFTFRCPIPFHNKERHENLQTDDDRVFDAERDCYGGRCRRDVTVDSCASAALDAWTQERLSVDFGSQFKISEPLSVYFNAKNLTNTALKFTEGPGENRIIQREFYGVTLQVGGNYKF